MKNAEEIKNKTKKNRKKVNDEKKKAKMNGRKRSTHSNSTFNGKNKEWEKDVRMKVILEQLKVLRRLLPGILKRFSKIKDPRNPKTIKHKLTVVLLYGLIMFILQMDSRREANKTMTMPEFRENLMTLFPELESTPHADTIFRILKEIDVEEIQETIGIVVKKLLKNKKFKNHKLAKFFVIAIDGTEKFESDVPWTDEALQKELKTKKGKKTKYYVYVLEANLVFANGITIPILTEFLEGSKYNNITNKQDCETKALKRMIPRLKGLFPRLNITLLLDGLYPNGPIIALLQKYHFNFMIVLQDKSLPNLWEEAKSLKGLKKNNILEQIHCDRYQHFWWVKNIKYYYGPNKKEMIKVNVVVCEEKWKTVDNKTGEIVQKKAKHAWVTSLAINKKNVHNYCNNVARHRWEIENNILVEKHHGYNMEHLYAKDWNAMKGFHYLMRLGHLINVLGQHTVFLFEFIKKYSIKFLFALVRSTIARDGLDKEVIKEFLKKDHQIRLAFYF